MLFQLKEMNLEGSGLETRGAVNASSIKDAAEQMEMEIITELDDLDKLKGLLLKHPEKGFFFLTPLKVLSKDDL